ncbi:MAG: TatD family hydrolase [Nitrososphaerales archaeon]
MPLTSYVDVHAHIGDSSFDKDRDEVLKRAKDIIILEAGVDHKSNLKALKLAKKYPNVKACLGYYPEYLVDATDEDVDKEIRFIKDNASNIVAISEIGLDYKFPEKEKQKAYFRKFLGLAEELRLPVVLHSRRAAGAVIRESKEFKIKVDLHAFVGNEEELKSAIDAGFYLSLGPNIVFNEYKQHLASVIPFEQLLTETDSPVLGPIEGERNEPNNVKMAVKKVAEICEVHLEDVRKATYDNARKVFGI